MGAIAVLKVFSISPPIAIVAMVHPLLLVRVLCVSSFTGTFSTQYRIVLYAVPYSTQYHIVGYGRFAQGNRQGNIITL